MIPLTATIATYVLICKAQIIEEKLKVFWNQKVIATLKEMYAVMLRNPYLAVAAVIVTLISALSNMNKEMTDKKDLQKRSYWNMNFAKTLFFRRKINELMFHCSCYKN